MKFMSIDSPLMQGLGKLADLMFLNILALVCCIPIVTIGASWTALYYMALKIVRDEEVYIARDFFKSFRQNFRQATIIWLLQIVVMLILGMDFQLMYGGSTDAGFPLILQVLLLAVTLIAVITFMFVYPVLSKFDNSLKNTLKNSFLMGLMQLPKVLIMVVLWLAPPLLAVFAIQVFPLVVLFGMSLPAFLSALMYNKFFKRTEERMLERAREAGELPQDPGSEDEHIFSDMVENPSENKERGV